MTLQQPERPQNLLLQHFAGEVVKPWKERLEAANQEIVRLDQYALELENVLRQVMADLLGVSIPQGEAVLATAKQVLGGDELARRLTALAGGIPGELPESPSAASEVGPQQNPLEDTTGSPSRIRKFFSNLGERAPDR